MRKVVAEKMSKTTGVGRIVEILSTVAWVVGILMEVF